MMAQVTGSTVML